jgi:2,4-diketo-3-deoxy-L-fuconate hydrolase
MRIANVAGRLSLLIDDRRVDVCDASEGRFTADPQAVFERWDEFVAWTHAAAPHADGVPLDAATVEAPVPRPRQVFAIGLNYASHAAESGIDLPEYPTTFTKFPTSIAGPASGVELPSEKVDWEAELVVAIGRRAHRIAAADAWNHVAGLTVGQDLSERAVQLRPPVPQFSLGKSFPGFAPIGPYLVTPDELPDPDDLELSCALNGEEVQRARTSDLIFSVPDLIEYLSAVLPLLPGDLIFTGTPSGVGAARTPPRYLTPGDELVTTIDGIGTLRTRAHVTAAA